MVTNVAFSSSAVKGGGFPPSSNTGGKFSRRRKVSADGVLIDFLAFSFPGHDLPADEIVPLLQAMLAAWVGSHEVQLVKRGAGLYGYRESWFVTVPTVGESVQLGVCAYGGNGGAVYVSLTGTGTARVKDWPKVRQCLEQVQGRVTRLDIACDFLHGEVTFQDACHAYQRGLFTGKGRPPSHTVMGDLLQAESVTGRTLYVGNRKNGKMFRGYEKGKQMGDTASKWFRCEVEFRAVDQVLDLAMLTSPAEYFAGAYPYLGTLAAKGLGATRLARTTEKGKIHLHKLLHYGRLAYGRLLACMQDAGASADDIVSTLREDGIPRRLIETIGEMQTRYGGWSLYDFEAALREPAAPF